MATMPTIFDVPKAAKLFGLNEYTIRRMFREGTLPGSKIGGKIYFSEDQIRCLFPVRREPALIQEGERGAF
jgi:helix-turn-helix protein